MKRLFFLLLLIHLLSSFAGAAITYSAAYYVVDAAVDTTLGSDTQHDEGIDPVTVMASAGANTSGAAALAQGGLLSVGCWSALTFDPGLLGGAGSSAGSVVFGLESTTPWTLTLNGTAVVPDIPPGVADAGVAALVQDAAENPIFTYSFADHGPALQGVFGAGTYNVLLYANSMVGIAEPVDGTLDLLSAAELNATVAVVPVPGAVLLAFLGTGGVVLLRRKLQ